jgi:hypothetical protein
MKKNVFVLATALLAISMLAVSCQQAAPATEAAAPTEAPAAADTVAPTEAPALSGHYNSPVPPPFSLWLRN